MADLEGMVRAKSIEPPARRARRNEAQAREKIMKTATAEFARHGFAGARVARIVKNAGSNPRMLYHYFGSKQALYISVLENALGGLRNMELRLDVEHLDPREGLLQLFDFMNSHFEQNRDLVTLLTAENLLKARYMRKSAKIRDMSSPVLEMIAMLLEKGAGSGQLAKTLDPLRLYVLMVALSQFHLSNAHTLSVIFASDLSSETWRGARKADARTMLEAFFRTAVSLRREPSGAKRDEVG